MIIPIFLSVAHRFSYPPKPTRSFFLHRRLFWASIPPSVPYFSLTLVFSPPSDSIPFLVLPTSSCLDNGFQLIRPLPPFVLVTSYSRDDSAWRIHQKEALIYNTARPTSLPASLDKLIGRLQARPSYFIPTLTTNSSSPLFDDLDATPSSKHCYHTLSLIDDWSESNRLSSTISPLLLFAALCF